MNNIYSAETMIEIHAPIDAVWDALTNPEIIKQYLHGTTTETTWNVGDPITWKGVWKDQSYEDKGVVLANVPNQTLSTTHWSPMTGDEDKPENYHVVTYELQNTDDGTKLTLVQSNSPSQETADSMIASWKPILETLKSLLEK